LLTNTVTPDDVKHERIDGIGPTREPPGFDAYSTSTVELTTEMYVEAMVLALSSVPPYDVVRFTPTTLTREEPNVPLTFANCAPLRSTTVLFDSATNVQLGGIATLGAARKQKLDPV
jgi:hypothetical protein